MDRLCLQPYRGPARRSLQDAKIGLKERDVKGSPGNQHGPAHRPRRKPGSKSPRPGPRPLGRIRQRACARAIGRGRALPGRGSMACGRGVPAGAICSPLPGGRELATAQSASGPCRPAAARRGCGPRSPHSVAGMCLPAASAHSRSPDRPPCPAELRPGAGGRLGRPPRADRAPASKGQGSRPPAGGSSRGGRRPKPARSRPPAESRPPPGIWTAPGPVPGSGPGFRRGPGPQRPGCCCGSGAPLGIHVRDLPQTGKKAPRSDLPSLRDRRRRPKAMRTGCAGGSDAARADGSLNLPAPPLRRASAQRRTGAGARSTWPAGAGAAERPGATAGAQTLRRYSRNRRTPTPVPKLPPT